VARVRRTVGVYERNETRTAWRPTLVAAALAVASAVAVAAVVIL
jgi:hypothetical protein